MPLIPRTNRRPSLCVALLVCSPAFYLGIAEKNTAKSSCLLQAPEARAQTKRVNAVNSFDRGTGNNWAWPANLKQIKWSFAIAFVLAGCWTLCQEVLPSLEEKGSKKRDPLWDVTRSALMVLVVNGHFQMYGTNFLIPSPDPWFQGFYMPAYFIISGMFSKRRGDNYWPNLLVNNVINACLFVPIYAQSHSPLVGSLWFLWALAVYRGLLQPSLAACHEHFGRCAGTCAGFLVAVAFDYAFRAVPLRTFHVLNIDLHDQQRIGFHAVFFAAGFAMDAGTLRQLLQRKVTLALALLHIILLVWAAYGIYPQSKYWRANLFAEDLPADFMPFSDPRGWTLTVAQRTFASLSFIALLVPLADAQSFCMRFLCQMFAMSGTRTLYAYCLQFVFIERLSMEALQDKIDEDMLQYLPQPYSLCPHQCMQVLFMFSLSSPLAERIAHFMVSPQWVLDCAAGTKALLLSSSSGSGSGSDLTRMDAKPNK